MINSQKTSTPLRVCAAIIPKDGKILITQRPAHKKQGNFWEFPGGKIEVDESPQEALRRELREELDISIDVGPLVAKVLHEYDWGPVEIHAYRCRWTAGEIRHLEVRDHRWARPGELASFDILPADFPIIEKLLAMPIA